MHLQELSGADELHVALVDIDFRTAKRNIDEPLFAKL